MKRERFVVVAAAVAVAVPLRPLDPFVGVDVGKSTFGSSEVRHPDHIEFETVEPILAAHPERELRLLTALPFNNSAVFTNPVALDSRIQSQVLGSPLALLAA